MAEQVVWSQEKDDSQEALDAHTAHNARRIVLEEGKFIPQTFFQSLGASQRPYWHNHGKEAKSLDEAKSIFGWK